MPDILTIKVENGEMVFANTTFTEITGIEAYAQRLENRIGLMLNDWFVTPGSGINWFEMLQSKPVQVDRITDVVRKNLLADEGVLRIKELNVSFDKTTRKLSIDFQADTDIGLVTGGTVLP